MGEGGGTEKKNLIPPYNVSSIFEACAGLNVFAQVFAASHIARCNRSRETPVAAWRKN